MNLIGKVIREKRESLRWTIKELADKVGISDSTVNRIESGEIQEIKCSLALKIGKVLYGNPLLLLAEAELISETDLNPEFRIKDLEKLNSQEIESVQDFVGFLIYRKKFKEKGR